MMGNDALLQAYLAACCTPDRAKRDALLARVFAVDGTFRDPTAKVQRFLRISV